MADQVMNPRPGIEIADLHGGTTTRSCACLNKSTQAGKADRQQHSVS